jgi:hypothetical protein
MGEQISKIRNKFVKNKKQALDSDEEAKLEASSNHGDA